MTKRSTHFLYLVLLCLVAFEMWRPSGRVMMVDAVVFAAMFVLFLILLVQTVRRLKKGFHD